MLIAFLVLWVLALWADCSGGRPTTSTGIPADFATMVTIMIKQAVLALSLCVAGPAFGAVNLLSSTGADVAIAYEGSGVLGGSTPLVVDQSEIGLTEIAPGTRFESYLISISDFESCSLHPYEATFDFDAPVLGIQTDVNSLRSGRRTLDESGFNAAAPAGGIGKDDTVTLNGTLVVEGMIGGHRGVDPIRVFVEATAVPEFASLGVWGALSVAGVMSTNRRRR